MDKMTNINRNNNITLLYLLLDIGRFYASDCINSMRYDRETTYFWTTFWGLFKGRGINFMRGHNEGLLFEENIRAMLPPQCQINFVVPYDTTLQKEITEHIIEVEKREWSNPH